MKVTLLLADAAQAIQGKLYVLGGGWSITGPGPIPMAIAAKVEVPWDQANVKKSWKLKLFDADGVAVDIGGEQVEVGGQFEAGRPPGLKVGTPLDLTLAINFGPMPLAPDSRYTWRFFIEDKSDDDWYVGFTTRPQPPGGSPPG